MIKLGKMQKMEVAKKTRHGFYLHAKIDQEQNDVLLPGNQAPPEIKTGEEIEVFVYRDDQENLKATAKRPKLLLGELSVLKVVDTTNFGAFLDWGLEKDLLLPLKEQFGKVVKGRSYLVGLFVNSKGRLCATMKIYDLLSAASPYKENDRVQGTIYNINEDLGAFVAVDDKYHGLILNKELYGNYAIGDRVEVRIKKVRPDGKLELSVRQEAYNEIESDAQKILERLKMSDSILPLNDSSSPEQIKAGLNMSKRAFKRAVGRLLREGAVKITDHGIKLTWED
ncbi:MAG: S1-like domain-containing RNA-binding protein [Desulfotomaculaceae bacterium]|nr:S1-like domain-containing RNA-binding protein [Desulfotomaculaceae bacterium]